MYKWLFFVLCFSITNVHAQSKKKKAKMQLIALQKSNVQLSCKSY
ncbi:MAG: hypothetical protein V9E96_19605 [Chitinophagaceae bacterium]